MTNVRVRGAWFVLVLGLVLSAVLGGCAQPAAPARHVEKTATPLVVVPASRETKQGTGIVAWRLFKYQSGSTSGFTIIGLDGDKKMLRAARVFKVPGATKKAATTIAFVPLYPKASGRIRVLDNGLFDESSLTKKDFTKYFRWVRSDLAAYLTTSGSHATASDVAAERALTCLKAPSQVMGLTRRQTRLCGLGVHAMIDGASSETRSSGTRVASVGSVHILDDADLDPGQGEAQNQGQGEGEAQPQAQGEGQPQNQGQGEGEAQPQAQGEGQPQNQGQGEGEAKPDPKAEGNDEIDVSGAKEKEATPETKAEAQPTQANETTEAKPDTKAEPEDKGSPAAVNDENVPSGVPADATKTADAVTPLPGEEKKADAATEPKTADASALGADKKAAGCEGCASTVETLTAQIAAVATKAAPDYYQVTLNLSAFGLSANVSIAITNTGNIYASGGVETSPTATNTLPAFSTALTSNWVFGGKVDDFLAGKSETFSGTAGFINVNYAQNSSGYAIGIGPAIGEGVTTGISYGVNLTELAKNNGNSAPTYSPWGTDANGQPIGIPY